MILNKEGEEVTTQGEEVTTQGEVNIIESDLGCGTNIDEVLVFGTVEAANVFIQEFNNVNLVGELPDWYVNAALA